MKQAKAEKGAGAVWAAEDRTLCEGRSPDLDFERIKPHDGSTPSWACAEQGCRHLGTRDVGWDVHTQSAGYAWMRWQLSGWAKRPLIGCAVAYAS